MNTFLIPLIITVLVVGFAWWLADKEIKAERAERMKKLPEYIKVELRAHKKTYWWGEGTNDKTPYRLEYKRVDDDYWWGLSAFQKCKNKYISSTGYAILPIEINDQNELNQWKQKFKTLKDINDFKDKQNAVLKTWEQKLEDENCLY